MEKLIARCGMDCAACEARIATVTNNKELRAKKAAEWKIPPEKIDCTGCQKPELRLLIVSNVI